MRIAVSQSTGFGLVRDRLALKIGIQLFALALAISVVVTWVANRTDREAEKQRQENAVSTFLDSLLQPLSTAVWRVDMDQTQQFVDAIAALPIVRDVAVEVVGGRGGAIVASREAAQATAADVAIARELTAEDGGQGIGRIRVALDGRAMEALARARLSASFQSNLAVVFSMTLATFVLVYANLSLPLQRIAVMLSKAGAGGRFGEGVDMQALGAVATRNDSIGVVAAALRRQFDSLAVAVGVLEQMNESLEARIAERTRQLEENEHILTAAIESMDAAVSIYAPDGTLFEWNDKYVDFFPETRDLVRLGAPSGAIFAAHQAGGYVPADRDANEALRPGIYDRNTPGGRFLRTTIRAAQGGGTVSISVDLTELKRSLEKAEVSVALMNEAIRSFKLVYAIYTADETLVDFSVGHDWSGALRDLELQIGEPFSKILEILKQQGMVEALEGSTVVDGQTWTGNLPLRRRVGAWDRNLRNGRFLRTNVSERKDGGYIVVTADLTEVHEARRQAEISAQIAESAIVSVGASYSAWDESERLLRWGSSLRGDAGFHNATPGMPWLDFVANIRTRSSPNLDGETRLADGRGWTDDVPLRERVGLWEREKADGSFYRSIVTRLPSGVYIVVTQDLTDVHQARREAEINAGMTAAAIKSIGASFSAWSRDERLIRWESALPNDFKPESPFAVAYPGMPWAEFTARIRADQAEELPGETMREGARWRDPLPLASRIGIWDREKADRTVLRSVVSRTQGDVYIVVTQDFTEINQTRKRAERNEEVMREAIVAMGAVYSLWDTDGRLSHLDKMDPNGQTGLHAVEVPLGSDFAALEEAIRRVRGGEEIAEKSTLRDGKPFSRQPGIAAAQGLWDRRFPDGGYVRTTLKRLNTGEYLLVSIDLTEIDQARQKADEAVEITQEIMNHAVRSFGVYDAEERLKLFGTRSQYNTGAPVGTPYREILERRRAQGISEIAERSTRRDGKSYLDYTPMAARTGVWERCLADGQYWKTTVVKLSSGGFAVFTIDLTDMHKAREALAKNEKMAALGGLVAGVAHEVNTPIGVSLTAASLHGDALNEITAAYRKKTLSSEQFARFLAQGSEVMDLLARNLKRAAALISNFKQVSVDQTSDMRRRFELRGYVGEVVANLTPVLRNTNISVAIDGADVEIDGYPGAVAQIVTNLVMNAVAHAFPSREKPGTIRFAIGRADGDKAFVSYADDGVGMDSATLRKMFDPFFTTKRGSGGTGLGMTIVHNLVSDRLGGTIEVDSKPNDGLRMSIVIPVVSPQERT